MKKALFFSLMAAGGFAAHSQTKFGIQGGANFGTVHQTRPAALGGDNDSKTKVGFLVGAIADVDFGGGFSFRPELNYLQRGGLEETTNAVTNPFLGTTTTNIKTKTVFGYAQLSPNFVYNFGTGNVKFFAGIGPDFALGISGRNRIKTKITNSSGDTNTSTDQDIKFDGDDSPTDSKAHYKAFDFGVNGLAGFKMKQGLFMSVGYTFGISNINPSDNDDFETKNRGFHVKLGYMFGGK